MKLVEIGLENGQLEVWVNPGLEDYPEIVCTILGKVYSDLHPMNKLHQHVFHNPNEKVVAGVDLPDRTETAEGTRNNK